MFASGELDRPTSAATLSIANPPASDAQQAIPPTPPPKCSSGAERMRLSRLRRRDGTRAIPFEVRDVEIENLVRFELLDAAARDDRTAIARALGNLLDRIPVAWWQKAVEMRRRQ
jgi:hypothetical protein